MQGLTVTQAYKRGMSLSKALKAEPAKVRLTMLAELERLRLHTSQRFFLPSSSDLAEFAEHKVC